MLLKTIFFYKKQDLMPLIINHNFKLQMFFLIRLYKYDNYYIYADKYSSEKTCFLLL